MKALKEKKVHYGSEFEAPPHHGRKSGQELCEAAGHITHALKK